MRVFEKFIEQMMRQPVSPKAVESARRGKEILMTSESKTGPWKLGECRKINGCWCFATKEVLDRIESEQCLIKTGCVPQNASREASDEGYPVDKVFWEMVNEELK